MICDHCKKEAICRAVVKVDEIVGYFCSDECRDAWKKMAGAEWQHQGGTNWVFGVKVRGFVRNELAKVYLGIGNVLRLDR